MATVHLRSKFHRTEGSGVLGSVMWPSLIEEIEDRTGHSRTLVIGDFNMQPFEHGMVGAEGFHATAHADIARQGKRTVDRVVYRFFYNPMWRLMGSETPGTFFRRGSDQVEFFWHMFDQVLIRPDLIASFSLDSLIIDTHDGVKSLVNDVGRPTKAVASDHLPVVFTLRV